MTVYVDDAYIKFGRMVMCHMIATDSDELHAMAQAIGVRRHFCQFAGTYKEHYDVSKAMRIRAVQHGAVEITSKELGRMIVTRQRAKAEAEADEATEAQSE